MIELSLRDSRGDTKSRVRTDAPRLLECGMDDNLPPGVTPEHIELAAHGACWECGATLTDSPVCPRCGERHDREDAEPFDEATGPMDDRTAGINALDAMLADLRYRLDRIGQKLGNLKSNLADIDKQLAKAREILEAVNASD